ncbi:unnamed protein product [Blepharisma stoltei]|uniref:Uncharacterized protein n=1 Tax=Blepharisma stoltei TaxID=1481888 RepID=A0AAU9KDE5_9CILI|nr:unnamed protein product [Blepharisma stoltei]
MGSTQTNSIATLDTLSHQIKDPLNSKLEILEKWIKSTKVNAIKTIAFIEITKIYKNPEFSLSLETIPSLRLILNSNDQNIIFDSLSILLQYLKSNQSSIDFIVHNGVLQDIFKLCSHNSEKIIGISIKFLLEILEISKDARVFMYFSGVIESLAKLIAHENLTIRSAAIDIINKLYFNEEVSVGKIVNSEILEDLVAMAKSSYWMDRFSIAAVFTKIIGDISDEKIQMGMVDSLLESLGSETSFLINSSLICLAYMLELGTKGQQKNPYQSACKASKYFPCLKSLTESNCFAKIIWNRYFCKNDLKIQMEEKILIEGTIHPIIIETSTKGGYSTTSENRNDNFPLDSSKESNFNTENYHNLTKDKADPLASIDFSSSQYKINNQAHGEKNNEKSNKSSLRKLKPKILKRKLPSHKKAETKEKEIQTNDFSDTNTFENQENITIPALKNKKSRLAIEKSSSPIEITPSFERIKITLIKSEPIEKKAALPQPKKQNIASNPNIRSDQNDIKISESFSNSSNIKNKAETLQKSSFLQKSTNKSSEEENSFSGLFTSQIPVKTPCNKEYRSNENSSAVKEVPTKQPTNQPQSKFSYTTFNDLELNSSFYEQSDLDSSFEYSFISNPNCKVEDLPGWASTFTGSSKRKWNGNLEGPKKKDGTPDMRYGANYKHRLDNKSQYNFSTLNETENTKFPSWASTFTGSKTRSWNGNLYGPKKLDGTPDMRYKENYA